ncbi:hypothetical protein N7468_007954 [Penicillium chermesinum]|uniref:Uncharacterized protein n=1 Tax=Penicillium chermesinum TaxID=63820 RepID=A0A9W9THU3_9EURO|nr:uncharacterized protein N7468_007954 [Penicillium chermesinum]KAJ5223412.1 hypothetical protein N7468_007954 [Penicillium chermesinum]
MCRPLIKAAGGPTRAGIRLFWRGRALTGKLTGRVGHIPQDQHPKHPFRVKEDLSAHGTERLSAPNSLDRT